MNKNSIFIGATGQNVGKTTLCLGMIAALKKRFQSTGFIKPVGQQHVKIDNGTNVDKDVVLFKKHFHLLDDWADMSPVIIPSGFTRDFLDGTISERRMQDKILHAFKKIESQNEYTIVEGTGHIGVGSIVNMNNAKIASLLGLEMVIIASGGLGSAHDELALNIEMCRHYQVKVRGVILNRVLDDKREMILEYFPKSLKKWDIPLIGCVPYNAFLSIPTIKDFENLFDTVLLSGEEHRYRHFQSSRLVASSVEAYLSEIVPNELVITPASREDIILATLEAHRQSSSQNGTDFCNGMILTSNNPPSGSILEKIKQANIPVLYAPVCSYDAMKMITSFNTKIRVEDRSKIQKAISLVEQNLNLDILCDPVCI
jgi:phosphate acetyltransferase